jgi:hypothetical protein
VGEKNVVGSSGRGPGEYDIYWELKRSVTMWIVCFEPWFVNLRELLLTPRVSVRNIRGQGLRIGLDRLIGLKQSAKDRYSSPLREKTLPLQMIHCRQDRDCDGE